MQHAENLLCDLGEEVFAAEYQNDPSEKHPSSYDLTAGLVAARVFTSRMRFTVPHEARVLTAATDLNHYGLHSVAVAFCNDQTAAVSWYGRHDNDGQGIIERNTPEGEAKRRMFEALVKHGRELAALPFARDGQSVRPALWVSDGGYMHDVAQRYAEGPGRALGFSVMVARGYSADRYRPSGPHVIGKPREQVHFTESTMGRFLAFNADHWREVSQRAWLGTPGAPGGLSLFDGQRHSEFAEQVCREKLVEKLQGQFGPVWRWHVQPGWHDYGDALTMAYVAAAWGGIGTAGGLPAVRLPATRRRPRGERVSVIQI